MDPGALTASALQRAPPPTPPRPKPLNIAIIGAGLAGTSLALSLLPNTKCTIYELRPSGYEQGQHISLAPNALRVLHHLGLLEKLKTLGYEYENLDFRGSNGSRIATFENGSVENYGFPAMRIHRRFVQEVLVEECREKGIEVRFGMKLVRIEEHDGDESVALNFANGVREVVDLVIGADGLHSVVREYVAPSEAVYAHMLGITGSLPRCSLHSSVEEIGLPSHFIGTNGFLAVMPSSADGQEIGFFSTMEFEQEKSREEWEAMFRDKEQIQSILTSHFNTQNGWCDLVSDLCEKVDEETLCTWPFFIAPKLQSWSSSSQRVLVLGDAAHAMIPTGGLGASLAFEDAECMSEAIKFFAEGKASLGEIMNLWEKHRKERLALIQAFTDRNRKIRAPGGTVWAQTLKEWILWTALHFVGSDEIAGPIYRYDSKVFREMLRRL